MNESNRRPPSRSRRRNRKEKGAYVCVCCGGVFDFCWTCPCGFSICQACMYENAWGLTCNNITWECPDCGAIRGF